MTWIDAVEIPQGVLSVYGGTAPSLAGADVTAIELTHRGPSVVLSVVPRDFPADPPPAWARQGLDAVLLTLFCLDVQDVRLAGWGRQVTADISMERVDGRVAVRVGSPDATLTLTALSVDVQKVSAYRRAAPDAAW